MPANKPLRELLDEIERVVVIANDRTRRSGTMAANAAFKIVESMPRLVAELRRAMAIEEAARAAIGPLEQFLDCLNVAPFEDDPGKRCGDCSRCRLRAAFAIEVKS